MVPYLISRAQEKSHTHINWLDQAVQLRIRWRHGDGDGEAEREGSRNGS